MVVAAYRDRYQINDHTPLGALPEGAARKTKVARTRRANE